MTMKQVQWERAIMVVPDHSTVSQRDATRLNSSWTVGLSRSQWTDWQWLVKFSWTQSCRVIDNQPDQSVQLDPTDTVGLGGTQSGIFLNIQNQSGDVSL